MRPQALLESHHDPNTQICELQLFGPRRAIYFDPTTFLLEDDRLAKGFVLGNLTY